jgi:hypothetical protein
MKKKTKNQKGAVSVILTLFLLSILLVIGLGISTLMLQQLKLSSQAGQSTVSFYAADAGAERCLYQTRCGLIENPTDECIEEIGPSLDGKCASVGGVTTGDLTESNSQYEAKRESETSITSVGQFRTISRSLLISW